MSKTFVNRTRGAQTTRPPQRMNPETGMSEGVPVEAGRDVSPSRREPRRGEGYTVFVPDEKKRQAIQRVANEETKKVEEYRSANRPHYSYVGTVGGGESSVEAGATSVAPRKLPPQGSNLTPLQKSQKYKQEAKERKEREFEEMKERQRQKTMENEKREKERTERLKAEKERTNAAWLDGIESKSSGKSGGRPAIVSSPATASGGVRTGNVDALKQLESMFPSADKDVLKSLLQDAGNNIDDVIQYLSWQLH